MDARDGLTVTATTTRYHAAVEVKDVSESPWRSCVRAVVTVTWSGGESVVCTNDDREPINEGQPAEVLAVAIEAIGLLPIYAGWGDCAEGVFEFIGGEVVEVVAQEAA